MNTAPKFLFFLTAVAALSLAYPASVQAVPTTYKYTGNPFTDVSGPYTTSMFVTAMVTLAGPLGANMPLTDVTSQVTAFTLFDGVQTIRNTTPQVITDFEFATNASGEINLWNVGVGVGETAIVTFQVGSGRNSDFGDNPSGFGRSDTPGEWSQGIVTPDAGSTLSLMTLTLMALGLVARRFQRAAG